MNHVPDLQDPRVQARLAELQATIRRAYPTATFAVARGEDPEGIYLTATVDIEDLDEVTALVLDRLVEIQVDEALPVYMVPDQPPARVLAQLRAHALRPVVALLPAD
jgi:hypothetical protein